MVSRRWLLKVSAIVAATFALARPVRGQPLRRIAGEVLDKNNKAIHSVLVSAYRQKVKIGETTTKDDGKYSLEFSGDTPIDTVWYQQTAHLDGVLEDLCGSRDQNISKTLYLRGDPLNLFQAQEVLSALERVYYLVEGTPVQQDTTKPRIEVIGVLRKTVPDRLIPRLNTVANLYIPTA